MPQRYNYAVPTIFSHSFMKHGDAISPHMKSESFSSPPTDAELASAFGLTAAEINTVTDPFLAIIKGGAGNPVRIIVVTDDTFYYTAALNIAV